MKVGLIVSILLISHFSFAQPVPIDSLYLGQNPPGEIPVKFTLYNEKSFVPAERIALSKDGKFIVYHENNGYDVSSKGRIRIYCYQNQRWSRSEILFEGYTSPSFSENDDTLYIEKNNQVWYSIPRNGNWENPVKLSANIPYWHYFQSTHSGAVYASIPDPQKPSLKVWACILNNCNNWLGQSLGSPLNSETNNLDFFISKDESYFIFAANRPDLPMFGYFDLYISFRRKDRTWTIPQNLGKTINIPNEVRWGPYVSPDQKYLFYSRSSTKDNADACTNWVRIDALVEKLKYSSDF